MKLKKAAGRAIALAAAMTAVIVTGCGAGGKELPAKSAEQARENAQTELTVFYSGTDVNEVAVIEQLCENFMRENPDIILRMQTSSKGIYTENLKIKAALNEFPDILQVYNPGMFEQAGMLGEIPEEVAGLLENPFRIEGTAYAVPLYTTTYGIIYNQALFKSNGIEPPGTYEEFLEICQKLKERGVTPLAIGGSRSDMLGYWLNYFYQIDVVSRIPDWQELRDRGEVSFRDEEVLSMLRDYKELMSSEYILEDSINMDDNQLVTHLVNSDVAMVYSGPWMFSQILDASPQAGDSDKNTYGEEIEDSRGAFRIGWFFMPDREGSPVAMTIDSAKWAISRECGENPEKKRAAALFFRYFYEKTNYRNVLQSMYAIPTTKEAILYPAIPAQQGLLVDYRYADKSAEYFGSGKTQEGFEDYLYKIADSVIADSMSIETAVEKLDEKWSLIMME